MQGNILLHIVCVREWGFERIQTPSGNTYLGIHYLYIYTCNYISSFYIKFTRCTVNYRYQLPQISRIEIRSFFSFLLNEIVRHGDQPFCALVAPLLRMRARNCFRERNRQLLCPSCRQSQLRNRNKNSVSDQKKFRARPTRNRGT